MFFFHQITLFFSFFFERFLLYSILFISFSQIHDFFFLCIRSLSLRVIYLNIPAPMFIFVLIRDHGYLEEVRLRKNQQVR